MSKCYVGYVTDVLQTINGTSQVPYSALFAEMLEWQRASGDVFLPAGNTQIADPTITRQLEQACAKHSNDSGVYARLCSDYTGPALPAHELVSGIEEARRSRMANKRYSADLQERLDDEIEAVRAQLAAADAFAAAADLESPAGAPAPGPGAAGPPTTLHEPAPAAPAPPVQGSGSSLPPRSVDRELLRAAPGRRRQRLLLIVAGALAVALLLIVGAIFTLTTSPSTSVTTPTPTAGPTPTATPIVSPFAEVPIVTYPTVGLLLLLLLLVLVFLALRRRGPAPAIAVSAKTPQGPEALKALDLRLNRLEQLRSWMGEDPDLERLIDDAIGRRVSAAERRQRYFSAGIGTLTLIGGWLLSAVSPPAGLLRLLLH